MTPDVRVSERVAEASIESLAAAGVIVSLTDAGASLPARPMGHALTIPLDMLGSRAELRLPKGVTPRELRLVVQYIETLLLADYVPTEYTDGTAPRFPVPEEGGR